MNTIYRFDRADVVLSLDADFLCGSEPSTRYAHDFANRRTRGDRTDMNRLYMVESTMTATGGKADHRLPMRYVEIELFAQNLASALGVAGVTGNNASDRSNQHAAWMNSLAQDLRAHQGASIVIPGPHQSAAVHALAHAMNHALGNFGKTVYFTAPLEQQPTDEIASIRELAQDLDNGTVELLLIMGGNPAYDAPADLGFPVIIRKAKTSVHMAVHSDETAAYCDWLVPESHFLETWGDARAFDGTITILQPLIETLYDSHAQIEVLDVILGSPGRPAHDIVRAHWQAQSGAKDFESWWQKSVWNGLVEGSSLPEITPKLKPDGAQAMRNEQSSQGFEIVLRPDVYLYDGRFANNTWLEELPQPMTKLTWDNAVHLSPATARNLGVWSEERVKLAHQGRVVEGAVWVIPGHPDGSATVHLGRGRTRSGRAANGAGFDVYPLRTTSALWCIEGAQITKVGKKFPLAVTQTNQSMEGRTIVISDTAARYRSNPDFVKEETEIRSSADHSIRSGITQATHGVCRSI